MKKEFTKESTERKMFVDFWNLCQKYWIPEKEDAYWAGLVKDTDEFVREYSNDFAQKLVLALIETKDEEARNK